MMPEEFSATEVLFTAYVDDQRFTTPEEGNGVDEATNALYQFAPSVKSEWERHRAFEDAVTDLNRAASRQAFAAGLRAGLSLRQQIEK